MKTAIIMKRNLNGVNILQDSQNEFFNANDLLALYSSVTGRSEKRITQYLALESTKEYLSALVSQNQNNKDSCYYKTKRGKNGGTWMHPYLFIDFAMWLSPEFKANCIKWIYDNLIKLRNETGDSFKEVNEALFEMKPNSAPWIYANEAKMINKLVFGSPEKGQRNLATEDQLTMLKALQKADVKLIHQGHDPYDRYEQLKKVRSALLLTQ